MSLSPPGSSVKMASIFVFTMFMAMRVFAVTFSEAESLSTSLPAVDCRGLFLGRAVSVPWCDRRDESEPRWIMPGFDELAPLLVRHGGSAAVGEV